MKLNVRHKIFFRSIVFENHSKNLILVHTTYVYFNKFKKKKKIKIKKKTGKIVNTAGLYCLTVDIFN